ncbi:MAG: hypothetical protein WCH46_02505 [bacterium]
MPTANPYLNINGTTEEADRIFIGLSASGKVVMPLTYMFWGDYFGMCTDKYDINWMVSFAPEKK